MNSRQLDHLIATIELEIQAKAKILKETGKAPTHEPVVAARALLVTEEVASQLDFFTNSEDGITYELSQDSEHVCLLSTQFPHFQNTLDELLAKELPFEVKMCEIELVYHVNLI